MKYFLTCFLLFLSFVSFGQNLQKKTDAIYKNLSTNDSIIYLDLKKGFAKHINPNPDSSLYYSYKIKEFSLERNYKIGISEAEYFKAFYFRRIQKFDSAVFYFDKSSKLSEKYKYKRGIALSQNGLCRIYYFLGQIDNALEACEQCLTEAKGLTDLPIITDTYTAFGNIYLRQNDLKKAVKYFLKADSIHVVSPQRPDIIAATYQSLGTIFEELKDYDKSEQYFLKSNDEFRKLPIDVTFYLNTTNLHLGSLYYHKGNLKKADSLLLRMYKYFKGINEGSSIAKISTYLGLIRLEQKNLSEAEDFLKEGFVLSENKNYGYETAIAALELGKLYLKKNEPKKAINYLNNILINYNEEGNSSVQQETLFSLAEAYAQEKKFSKAYKTIAKAIKISDSLNIVQNTAKIREIDVIYQTEKKEQQITLLKSQNELAEQQKTNQRNQLLGGIGVTSLAGLFFFFLYRNRQKTTKKLQELDKAKSNFFTNISHEFRTPLTLISGPIQKQLKKEGLPDDERSNFEMMHRNSNRLLSLVDQLLDISKIEAGSLQLKVSKNELMSFIGSLTDGFTYVAKQKELNYIVNNNQVTIATWFDKDVIEKIIVNLLSNAIKYTPTKGSIVCNAFIKENQFYFEVKNTGKGLSKDELSKVFERFYQLNENKQGVGIGLALVKELVNLHKGTITVESIPNGWTAFNVILPIHKEVFKDIEIIDNVQSQKEELINIETSGDTLEANVITDKSKDPDIHQDSDSPILLIVDDNVDIRTYINNIFKDSYTILTAKNGQEGIDLAIERIPDIIISDIMMPVKNGIELCNTLKVDEHTSHIPIILLTAKAGEQNEIEGIKTGADDYVTKPFNEELLQLRVQKLIESRRKLQERYSQEVILRPKDIAITSVDEQFLQRLQTVLDDKLIEASFSVEDFSQAIGMSRMQLHRKLKALTGLSATEFIRSQRLKLAAQLLKKSEINVSQVGYSVGFNDHAYFSKCFKEMYHCTPTEYANNTK